MKAARLLVATASALSLASCATPYQQSGSNEMGGYEYKQTGPDQFTVDFRANGFTTPTQASDFAMLRAAETTLDFGYTSFAIIGEGDQGGFDYYSGAYKPGKAITIKCFTGPPPAHPGRTFDAATVSREIRSQYHLPPR